MTIAQSNSAGAVLGHSQGWRTWCDGPDPCRSMCEVPNLNFLTPSKRVSWEELAGNVREVWGSTRGTPKPCRWFLGFVERQAPRSYRMVVLGWTPLSQKPIPRPVAQPQPKIWILQKIQIWKGGFFSGNRRKIRKTENQCFFSSRNLQKFPITFLKETHFYKNSRKLNRLSKERCFTVASTARSTSKIHENFRLFSERLWDSLFSGKGFWGPNFSTRFSLSGENSTRNAVLTFF